MQKFKPISYLCIILLSITACSEGNGDIDREPHKLIAEYKRLLLKEPNNCFYLGQIAASYQATYDIDNAIVYYQKAVKVCQNEPLKVFQLGICHYIRKERQQGIAYMDEAIAMSKKLGDDKLSNFLMKEKKDWLKKSADADWDEIYKALDIN